LAKGDQPEPLQRGSHWLAVTPAHRRQRRLWAPVIRSRRERGVTLKSLSPGPLAINSAPAERAQTISCRSLWTLPAAGSRRRCRAGGLGTCSTRIAGRTRFLARIVR